MLTHHGLSAETQSSETQSVKMKQNELNLIPSPEDHQEVSRQMMDLFFQNKKIYYRKDDIFPALKSLFENDPVYDRVGLKGRDEILNVLIEEVAIKEYWTVEQQIEYDKYGSIYSIGESLDPRDIMNGIK